MDGPATYHWTTVVATVRGPSHARTGAPNQDAVLAWVDPDRPARAVLAVADGHGSPKCFRSDVGARLAVEVAVESARGFLQNLDGKSAVAIKDEATRLLKGDVVKEWVARVVADQSAHPLAADELAKIDPTLPTKPDYDGPHLRPYGTTLLLVVVTELFILYLQLGDGDLIIVPDGADPTGHPALPRDDSLIANETTSLCMERPQRLFRCHFQPFGDPSGQPPPRLVMASTDGYSNSFASEADFLKVAADLYAAVCAEGTANVERDLAGWLAEASTAGSGDDVTVGLLCRYPAADPGDASTTGSLT